MNDLVKTSTRLIAKLDDYKQQKRQLHLKMLGWACLLGACVIVFSWTFKVYILPDMVTDGSTKSLAVWPNYLSSLGVFWSLYRLKGYRSNMDSLEFNERWTTLAYQDHTKQLEPGTLSVTSDDHQQGQLEQL